MVRRYRRYRRRFRRPVRRTRSFRGRSRFRRRRRGRFTGINAISATGGRRGVSMRYANTNAPYAITILNGQKYGTITFSLNDLHHFVTLDNTGALAAPTEIARKEEWFEWYVYNRVNMVEFSVNFTCNLASSVWIGMFCERVAYSVPTALTTTWKNLLAAVRSNKYCKAEVITGSGGSNNQRRLTMRIPIAKMTGNVSYRTDVSFQGTGGSAPVSPTLFYQFHLFAATNNDTGAAGDLLISADIKANLFCTLWVCFVRLFDGGPLPCLYGHAFGVRGTVLAGEGAPAVFRSVTRKNSGGLYGPNERPQRKEGR